MNKNKRPILLISLALYTLCLPAQGIERKAISSDLFGIFFEDLNYSADGGLYAEMVQNRSFEYSPSDVDFKVNKNNSWHNLTAWDFKKDNNALARLSIETASPIHPNNRHYIAIEVSSPGRDGCGLVNHGYDGINVCKGETYDFSAFLRTQEMPVKIRITDKDNKILGETTFTANGGQWKKYEATITVNDSCDNAALQVLLMKKGKADVDMVSLFPQKTFKNRKNGMRRDLAETIAALKPAFMRFPGGCLAHGDGVANIYRWKNTIGPLEQRKEDYNIWSYHQTMGLGYYEYLVFCEDIGAKPLPVLAAGVSCQNSARKKGTGQEAIPMEEMDAYVQDVLDLIEYCNGNTTTKWGAKRAEAGHPAPFNLEYIGIGNEDKITPEFEQRFKMIYEAVHNKYPNIKVIGTAGWNSEGEDWEKGWKVAKDLDIQLIDEHYYKQPQWFVDNNKRYDSYDRKGPKVYIGEYASRGNTIFNAIAEAAYLTAVERNGDVVALASYAPLLSLNGHTQWKPDLIYYDKKQIYPSINYYVQQLFSVNHGDYYWSGIISGAETVSCVEDCKTGDIILKLVNTTDTSNTVTADLRSFKRLGKKATLTVLKGERDEVKALPETTQTKVSGILTYEMPKYSLTVIRIHNKK